MSLSATSLAKAFAQDVGTAGIVFINRKLVRDRPRPRLFSVIDLECNWSIAPLRTDAIESAAPARVTGLFDAKFQAICKKAKGIEQRTLANPIFPITAVIGVNGWECCVFHSFPSVTSPNTR